MAQVALAGRPRARAGPRGRARRAAVARSSPIASRSCVERGASERVSGAEPVRSCRPPQRPLEHGVARREPRRIGSGSGSVGCGRSRRARPASARRSPRTSPARGRTRARARRARPAPASVAGAPSGGGSPAPRPPRGRGAARAASAPRPGGQVTSASSRRPRPLPQLVGEQRAHVVDERRRLQRVALLVGRPEGQEQHLLGPRDRRVEQVALARQRRPRGAAARCPLARARLKRAASSRNGSGSGWRGNSPSCRPHTNTARKRRARIASGSASSTRALDRAARAPARGRAPRAAPRACPPAPARRPRARAARRRRRAARRRRSASAAASGSSTAAARRCGAVQIASASATQRVEERLPAPRAPRTTASVRVRRAHSRGRLARGGDLVAADVGVQRVGDVRVGEPARRAQPGQQVGRAAAERRARARQHAGAEPGVRERRPPVARHRARRRPRAPGRARRRRRARAPRCPRAAMPSPHQLEHRGADELGLGALAARLQQPDRAVRRRGAARPARTARARGGAARRARGRRVVLGAVLEDHVSLGERLEQLDRRRAAGERGAARLVGERDADVGVAGERLDRVALQRASGRRTRRGTPAGRARRQAARAARRAPRARARRRRPRRAPRAGGGRPSRAARARPRAAGPRRSPPSRAPPRVKRAGADQRAAELGEQRRRAPPAKPGRRGRPGQRVQVGRPRRRRGRAGSRASRPERRAPAAAATAGDVAHQPRKVTTSAPNDDPRGRQLTCVVARRRPAVGTTSTGSRGSAARKRSRTAPALAAFAGPVISVSGIRPVSPTHRTSRGRRHCGSEGRIACGARAWRCHACEGYPPRTAAAADRLRARPTQPQSTFAC